MRGKPHAVKFSERTTHGFAVHLYYGPDGTRNGKLTRLEVLIIHVDSKKKPRQHLAGFSIPEPKSN
jgi:hypothetical protein